MMKTKAIAILLAALLLFGVAQAGASLSAELADGGMRVSWSGCSGKATLTVYRNDWPILVEWVDAADGCYSVPSGYIKEAGRYSVRLSAGNCCLTAEAGRTADTTEAPAPIPTEAPTEIPTEKPTALPTEIPVDPTIQPTVAPTVVPTAIPTLRPTPVPTLRPTQSPGDVLSNLASQVVQMTNEERASRGLNTLTMDANLTQAASVRAREIVESFSHTRPDGSSWSTVTAGASGENIAKGQSTAERVMAAWMSSDGHRANILREGFTRIGVCAYKVGNVVYWAQLFGR